MTYVIGAPQSGLGSRLPGAAAVNTPRLIVIAVASVA
jgi:hypothetical protein